MSDFSKILLKLAKRDPILGKVIKQAVIQAPVLPKNHFQSLVVAIINQQLSTRAVNAIEARFVALFNTKQSHPERSRRGGKFPKPYQILKKTDVS